MLFRFPDIVAHKLTQLQVQDANYYSFLRAVMTTQPSEHCQILNLDCRGRCLVGICVRCSLAWILPNHAARHAVLHGAKCLAALSEWSDVSLLVTL